MLFAKKEGFWILRLLKSGKGKEFGVFYRSNEAWMFILGKFDNKIGLFCIGM